MTDSARRKAEIESAKFKSGWNDVTNNAGDESDDIIVYALERLDSIRDVQILEENEPAKVLPRR